MKKVVKSLASVALIASMLFSFAACGVKHAVIKSKDFKNALEDVFDLDDDDYGDYSYDDYKVVSYYHDDYYIVFRQYDDEDDAIDEFEDIYDDFEDAVDDKDISGKYKMAMTKTEGYILFKGESDSDDFFDDDIYGGVYLQGDTVIVVVVTSDKDKKMDKVAEFLDAIGYSHL